MDLIITFLATHGAQTVTPRIVRMNGEGSIAESIDFQNILGKVGYILQKTATDTSSQNGLPSAHISPWEI